MNFDLPKGASEIPVQGPVFSVDWVAQQLWRVRQSKVVDINWSSAIPGSRV